MRRAEFYQLSCEVEGYCELGAKTGTNLLCGFGVTVWAGAVRNPCNRQFEEQHHDRHRASYRMRSFQLFV